MNILFDPEIFLYGRCGMTRYYAALYKGLVERGFKVDLPLLISGNDYLPNRWVLDATSTLSYPARKALNLSIRLAKQQYYRRLATGRYDAVLVTSPIFENQFLHYAKNTPIVSVIHDTMETVLLPHAFLDIYGDDFKRLSYLVNRATRIICVSQATKTDLLGSTQVANDRVAVVLSANLLDETSAPVINLPKQFWLFVGARSRRKGFDVMVRALAPLLKSSSFQLVCVGPAFSCGEQDFLRREGVNDKVQTVDASDAQLVYLYEKAFCLIYPSFYEGFGLPIAEAMTFGCPVITSPYTSLPEVAGEAALYADPRQPATITVQLERLIQDSSLRSQLIKQGKARANTVLNKERMLDEFANEFRQITNLGEHSVVSSNVMGAKL